MGGVALLVSLVVGVWRSSDWRAPRLRRWLDSSTGGAGLVECALELGARDGPAEELVRRQALMWLRAAHLPYPRIPIRSLTVSLSVCAWVTYDPPLSPPPVGSTPPPVSQSRPAKVSPRSKAPKRIKRAELTQREGEQARPHPKPKQGSRAVNQSTTERPAPTQGADQPSAEQLKRGSLAPMRSIPTQDVKQARRVTLSERTASASNRAPRTGARIGATSQSDPQLARYTLPDPHALTPEQEEAKRSLGLEQERQAVQVTLSVPLAPLELRDLSPQARRLLGEVGRLRRLRLHEAHSEHPDQHRRNEDERCGGALCE